MNQSNEELLRADECLEPNCVEPAGHQGLYMSIIEQAQAAELKRLRALNADLLAALKQASLELCFLCSKGVELNSLGHHRLRSGRTTSCRAHSIRLAIARAEGKGFMLGHAAIGYQAKTRTADDEEETR